MSDTSLRLPATVGWSCLQCGRSCEDWNEVRVEPREAERLSRLPLFAEDLPEPVRDGLPTVVSAHDPRQFLMRLAADGEGGTRCVLLERSQRCAIQAAHGEELKPATCRIFPFVFRDTPRGTEVAVSFACTAVVHGHGEPLERQRQTLAALLKLAGAREKRGVGIRLAPGDPLRWTDYEALELRLRRLLDASADVASGLMEQARLLRREAHLPELDPRPSRRLRRHVLAWLEARVGRPPRFRAPLPGLSAPEPGELLRRWLGHRSERRDLLRGGEVVFAHGLMLAELAVALDWSRSVDGGLPEAVAQVERGLSLHSDLVQRLERDPQLRGQAGRLFLAPRYAASMVLETGSPAEQGRHATP